MKELENFANQGYTILTRVLDAETNSNLIRTIEKILAAGSINESFNSYGVRNLMAVAPEVRALADSAPIKCLVEPFSASALSPFAACYLIKHPMPIGKWHGIRIYR